MQTDIVIIGGGPAGYVAAIRAAQLGADVVLIEKDKVGGTCLNYGCIPTKSLLDTVQTIELVQSAPLLGIQKEGLKPDLPRIRNYTNQVVRRLVDGVQFLMKKNRVQVIHGHGNILAPAQVEIPGYEGHITATKAVLVATGSRTRYLSAVPAEDERVWGSATALQLKEVPRRLAIIGAGAVGVEFAEIYSGLGSAVTLIEMENRILPSEDEDISKQLQKRFEKKGIQVLTSSRITETRRQNGARTLLVDGVMGSEEITVDYVLVAAGRLPNTEDMGLREVGVELDCNGFVLVNNRMETNIPGIYAAGDVTGGQLLAHIASEEAVSAIENALGYPSVVDHSLVPRCVYTHPEIAAVGLTEHAAKANGYEVKVGVFPFAASGRAVSTGYTEGFVKVVFDIVNNHIVGVHAIGPHVTEIISQATLAMKSQMGLQELHRVIFPHPTYTEAWKEALLDVNGSAIHM